MLAALRLWLAEPGLQASQLAVVTSGAVPAGPGDRVTQPHQAVAWGLVRSAQSEHPGRFVLIDSDAASLDQVPDAAGVTEDHLVADLTDDHVDAVFAGKVAPAWVSHPRHGSHKRPSTVLASRDKAKQVRGS